MKLKEIFILLGVVLLVLIVPRIVITSLYFYILGGIGVLEIAFFMVTLLIIALVIKLIYHLRKRDKNE